MTPLLLWLGWFMGAALLACWIVPISRVIAWGNRTATSVLTALIEAALPGAERLMDACRRYVRR